ncbi:hypothetical protein C8R43DRAFT_576938 [Mycena crocata]|nr:hypothetical protein C8R43DRAFT_576938 [Mycena crocata]
MNMNPCLSKFLSSSSPRNRRPPNRTRSIPLTIDMLTLLALLASLYLSVVRCSPAGGAIDFLLVGDPTGVVQCEPHTLTWQGGTAPFAVTVQDPVNSGDIYAFWAGVADNSILWDVDKIPKGSLPLSFLVQVVDVKGTKATSRTEIVTVGTTPLDASGLCSSPSSLCVQVSLYFYLCPYIFPEVLAPRTLPARRIPLSRLQRALQGLPPLPTHP